MGNKNSKRNTEDFSYKGFPPLIKEFSMDFEWLKDKNSQIFGWIVQFAMRRICIFGLAKALSVLDVGKHCLKQTTDYSSFISDLRVSSIKLRFGIDEIEKENYDGLLSIPDISSVTFSCNRDKLPSEAFIEGNLNYFMILKKLILPFFSVKSRIIATGKVFAIGNFEFKVFHCEPKMGKVSENSRIFCTKYIEQLLSFYTSESPLKSVEIVIPAEKMVFEDEIRFSLKNKKPHSHLIESL